MKISNFIKDGLTGIELTNLLRQIQTVLNGGVEFGTPASGINNMRGAWATGITPGVANTEFAVTHNLGQIPTGWLIVSIDQAGIIYKGATAWNIKQIFLKCNLTGVNYKIFVF